MLSVKLGISEVPESESQSATGPISSVTDQIFTDVEDDIQVFEPYELQQTTGLIYVDNLDCLLGAESKTQEIFAFA